MRRLFFFVLSVLSVLLVAACGKDTDSGSNDSTNSNNGNNGNDNGMADMEHGQNSPVPDGAREVEVNADQLAFSPLRIEAAVGESVAVRLTAGDVEHDLTVDELDLHVAAEAGRAATGGFTADQPGEYPFYCSVEGHRESGMEGTIVVT